MIANIERVANLFITKTVYAMLLALAIGVARWPFPFLPRHLTVVSSLTIGIPAFFLSLAPNSRRYVPGFIDRVLRFAVPAGFFAAVATFASYWLARGVGVDLVEARTTATVVLLSFGLWVLYILARPLNWWRALLLGAMVLSFVVALAVPWLQDFYALDLPPAHVVVEGLAIAAVAAAALEIALRFTRARPVTIER